MLGMFSETQCKAMLESQQAYDSQTYRPY